MHREIEPTDLEAIPLPQREGVRVGSYERLEEALDRSLVVLAMGEAITVEKSAAPNELSPEPRYELLADEAPAPAITRELEAYEFEELHARDGTAEVRVRSYLGGWMAAVFWVLAVLIAFGYQQRHPELVELGASSSIGLIERREWWRPMTAMFLHADGGHVAGNLASGFLFGGLVAGAIGALRGWAMILLTGVLANITVSWITFPEAFSSIGASTAVFGALGILSGLGIAMVRAESGGHRSRRAWLRLFAPLFGGWVILGWWGGGSIDGNTDVLGHVAGFAWGVPLGWFGSRWQIGPGNPDVADAVQISRRPGIS